MINVQKLQARSALSITPNDSTDLVRGEQLIYVGTGGNLRIVTADGDTETFENMASGSTSLVLAKRVLATGTTATGLISIR